MSETVYSGSFVDVELRDGREVVVHGPAVAIVAVDRENRVMLVRQERAGAGGKLLELPAGNVGANEKPIEAAERELREETGLQGGLWTEVASFFTTPGFCDERMHVFVARGVEIGEAEPGADEAIEHVPVPVAEVPALLPEIADTKTLVGLLLLLRLR